MIKTKKEEVNQCSLACVLVKKFYLDGRQEELSLEQLTEDDLATMKVTFTTELMDLNEPMSLLRRKAEIICKIHDKLQTYGELVTNL